MHILIITAALAAGGAERVISTLLNNWAGNGVRCSLILIHKMEHFYSVPDSVEIYEIGNMSTNPLKDKWLKYKTVRLITRTLNPDIVLTMPEEIGIYVLLSLFGLRIPIVVSERNNPRVMPNVRITRVLRRILYPHASGFIFQTEMAAEYFNHKIRKRGVVLCNPLDLSNIPEPYVGERHKEIVAVGRLTKQKNFKLLIDAFSRFQHDQPDYILTIYGEGKQRHELEQYAESRLNPNTYFFPGKCVGVFEKIKYAMMFVLSSDYEGMPNSLIEAMAMGLPVISTNCPAGGSARIIQNRVNGLLVPVNDVTSLYLAMKSIAEDNTLRTSISKEAPKIKDDFDARVVCKLWLDYLKHIINN